MTPTYKRSNKPIFWALFGAGGMLSALIGPALVLLTGLLIPLGSGFGPRSRGYDKLLSLMHHTLPKLGIVVVISLFLFHGMHRFYHTLHDFGVHIGPGIKATCHGLAALGTLVAIALALMIG
jgi:fumarate reductase subunit D